MRMTRALLFVLAAAGLSGAAPDRPAALRVVPFRDRDALAEIAADERRPAVQVALPDEAAGVTTSRLAGRSSFPRFAVEGIGRGDGALCITLTSADGYYGGSGRATLNTAARASGVAILLVPSMVRRLAALQAGELAIRVRAVAPRQPCGRAGDLLTTHWIGNGAGGGPLTVLLAGGGTGTRPDIRRIDDDVASPCETIADRGSMQSAYRFACTPRAADCRPVERLQVDWLRGTSRIAGFALNVRRSCSPGR